MKLIDFILIVYGASGWAIVLLVFSEGMTHPSRMIFSEYSVIVCAAMLIVAIYRRTRFKYNS